MKLDLYIRGKGGAHMATAEQIKSLIRAHIDSDNDKFKTVVFQIAAYEAKHGHDTFARELKQFADKVGKVRGSVLRLNNANGMFLMEMPSNRLDDLIVSEELSNRIFRILSEYRNRNKLQKYGLTNRRKILLEGRPGTGKTFTASVIAAELGLPLYTVQMDKVVTKFMGETSAKLRQIFDSIAISTGVYLFDEFDAIGADRGLDNEVGEARRILNSFLQFIEQDTSESIIIAATNNQKLLDQALFRRFDDVLHYGMPSESEIVRLFDYKFSSYDPSFAASIDLISKAKSLSHAEIIRVCDDAIKYSILNNTSIDNEKVQNLLDERIDAYFAKEA
mgnify:CR=1 FL=1